MKYLFGWSFQLLLSELMTLYHLPFTVFLVILCCWWRSGKVLPRAFHSAPMSLCAWLQRNDRTIRLGYFVIALSLIASLCTHELLTEVNLMWSRNEHAIVFLLKLIALGPRSVSTFPSPTWCFLRCRFCCTVGMFEGSSHGRLALSLKPVATLKEALRKSCLIICKSFE